MRLVLCGQKSFGRDVLKLLKAKGHDVALVVAPDHDSKRLDPLRAEAEDFKIPILSKLTSDKLPDDTDLIVTAHSHCFLSKKCRDKTRLGAIGYHPSLLPLHRGRDAVYWTIRDRDRIAGGSVYWLNETVDGGDIAASSWCFVLPDDTLNTLWRRELYPMGLRLLGHVIDEISTGIIRAEPQNPDLATWEPSVSSRPRLYRPELLTITAGGKSSAHIRSRAIV